MTQEFKEAKARSLREYIELKKTQSECSSFIDGYDQALKDTRAPEMLEMLKAILSHYEDVINGDYSPFSLRSDIDKAKGLIKK